jgi:hypothetical protein
MVGNSPPQFSIYLLFYFFLLIRFVLLPHQVASGDYYGTLAILWV